LIDLFDGIESGVLASVPAPQLAAFEVALFPAEPTAVAPEPMPSVWGWFNGLRALAALQIGFDGARITIPIRDARGDLRGVLRYDPFGRHRPQMRATTATQLGLIPHPTSETSKRIILVEGPPDMIWARSAGLPAIAVPGTNAWHAAWAHLLETKRVTIVMDCDAPGRRAATEISASLDGTAEAVDGVDLWPRRDDG
jgi:hypothetical protein